MPESVRATAVITEAKVEKSSEESRAPEVRRHHSNMHAQLLNKQTTIGSRAVQRFIKSRSLQKKHTISRPGDIHAQEAVRVEDWMMRMPDPPASQPKPPVSTPFITHKEKEEADDEPVETVQRQAVKEAEGPRIQRNLLDDASDLAQGALASLRERASAAFAGIRNKVSSALGVLRERAGSLIKQLRVRAAQVLDKLRSGFAGLQRNANSLW